MNIWFLILAAASYLIGSIPTGYITVKILARRDIREEGSKNMGATNVLRTTGTLPALFVFVLDALKGYCAVQLTGMLPGMQAELFKLFAALCVISGHAWTVLLGFKGGKGVATGLGAFLAIVPVQTLLSVLVFIAITFLTRYVSLASMASAAVLPVSCSLSGKSAVFTALSSLIAILVIYRHKENIKRLLAGNENKFGRKK
jgi:glycerol-3-phosphate acyltransferase PlsY